MTGSIASAARAMTPRILVFDIETTPSKSWHWQFYDECISPAQVIQETTLLCFAAKWLGEDMMIFERKRGRSDRAVCRALWGLLDEAELVVGHNGVAFDIKTANARFIKNGFQPPSPYKMADTLKIAKGVGKFGINKLDYLGRYLNIGKKTEHEGFDLWLKCMRNDPDAWARMETYNINDVDLTEELYLKLRPWDKKHPNVGIMYTDDTTPRCVCCGSTIIKEISKASYTAAGVYPSFRCGSCGKVMRGRSRDKRQDYSLANSL